MDYNKFSSLYSTVVVTFSDSGGLRKCGNLPIRKKLLIAWLYARPSVRTTGIRKIWNIEQEKNGENEKKRQASETQREKGRETSRDKKQGRYFFVGRTTWKLCSGGDKMRNASGNQWKEKMSGSEKKVNENTFDISSIKKFLEVSRCSLSKQRQRNVQKSALHVQSCFFC